MTWQRVYAAPREWRLPKFRFDQQRAKCEACRHCRAIHSVAGGTILRCEWNGRLQEACSAMRADGGQCGPDARLFEGRAL